MKTHVAIIVEKFCVDDWQGLNGALVYLETRVSEDEYQALYDMLHRNAELSYLIQCRSCKLWFLGIRKSQVYCCEQCSMRGWRNWKLTIRDCIVCGEEVVGNAKIKYCSRSCRHKAYYQRKIKDRYR